MGNKSSNRYFSIVSAIIAFIFSFSVSTFLVYYYAKLIRDKQKSDMINCSDNLNAQIYDSVMNSFSKVISVSEITKGVKNPERIPAPQLDGIMQNTEIFCIVFAPNNVISNTYPRMYESEIGGMEINTFFERKNSKIDERRIAAPGIVPPFKFPESNIRAMASYIPVFINEEDGPVFWGTVAALVPYPEIFDNVSFNVAYERQISCRISVMDEYTGEIFPFMQTVGPFSNEIKRDNISTTKYYFTTPIQIDMIPLETFYQSKFFILLILSGIFICLVVTMGVYSITNSFRRRQELAFYKVQARLVDVQSHVITSLSSLVENRDSDTGAHIIRTSNIVYMLATEAKKAGLYPEILTDEYCEILKNAAPMHDIGKISVPDNILKKPAKLTDEEYDVLKKHTVEGYMIIRSILGPVQSEDLVIASQEIAVAHHERWDGSGYPYGLAGDQIPLCARIMALADVFDALTSPRCYKAPFTLDEALELIKKESGTHFDPKLTEIFLQNKEKLRPMAEEAAKQIINTH